MKAMTAVIALVLTILGHQFQAVAAVSHPGEALRAERDVTQV